MSEFIARELEKTAEVIDRIRSSNESMATIKTIAARCSEAYRAQNKVLLAAEYAPMLGEYTRSPRSMSGKSSARLMVSRASQVGPNTEQICVGPFLKLCSGYWQWSKITPL